MKKAPPSKSKIADKTGLCIIGPGYVGSSLAQDCPADSEMIGFAVQ